MRILIITFLLTGCALEPISRNFKKPYRQRVIDCTERFMDGFGTDIKKTYEVCKEIEKGRS
jgi:hypothetical protein